MKCGQKGLALIKKWEGYGTKLKNGNCLAYLDTLPSPHLWSPNYKGLWTIGYGSTGPDVTEGTIWTEAQASARLLQHANTKAAEISAYLTRKINQNQFDALVSLAYNVGTGGMHDILNLVNAGEFDQAANSFKNYNHAGGRVVAGLTNRRRDERELFEWEVKSEVVAMSPALKNADNVQNAAVGGTFTVAGLWQYLPQVREFMTDHAGMICLGMVGVILGLNWINKNYWHISFNNGTYIPVGTKPEPAMEVDNADVA